MIPRAADALYRRSRIGVLVVLALISVLAWLVTLYQARAMPGMAMDASMATQPGLWERAWSTAMVPVAGMPLPSVELLAVVLGLVLFLAFWLVMMVAMMFPSAAPMVLLYATVAQGMRHQEQPAGPTWLFVAGYLLVWGAFGVGVFALMQAVQALAALVPALYAAAPYISAAALVAAGIYQLTPLKDFCLSHCRSPLDFVLHHWRAGRFGALRMGLAHGAYCTGCCWGLMAALVVLGLMNVSWMAAVSAVIFVEKVLPFRRISTPVIGAALALAGLALAVQAVLAGAGPMAV